LEKIVRKLQGGIFLTHTVDPAVPSTLL